MTHEPHGQNIHLSKERHPYSFFLSYPRQRSRFLTLVGTCILFSHVSIKICSFLPHRRRPIFNATKPKGFRRRRTSYRDRPVSGKQRQSILRLTLRHNPKNGCLRCRMLKRSSKLPALFWSHCQIAITMVFPYGSPPLSNGEANQKSTNWKESLTMQTTALRFDFLAVFFMLVVCPMVLGDDSSVFNPFLKAVDHEIRDNHGHGDVKRFKLQC